MHSIFIPGPDGALECLLSEALDQRSEPPKRVAIICHPHPLFEGNMHNKVVHTLARFYRDLSIPVIRFNFRGVGESEGKYADGIGEIGDLLAIIRWLDETVKPAELELAGFSFGSYIAAACAMKLENDDRIKRVVLIAPPVHHFDFQHYANHNCPTIVVQGQEDEVVPANEVIEWATTNESNIQLIQMKDTSHFFHGQLVALKQQLLDHTQI